MISLWDLREGKNNLIITLVNARHLSYSSHKFSTNPTQNWLAVQNIGSEPARHVIIPCLCAIASKSILIALTQNADYKIHHQNVAKNHCQHEKYTRPGIRRGRWICVWNRPSQTNSLINMKNLTWAYVLMILNTCQRCTGYQRVHRLKPNGLQKHQRQKKETKMADFRLRYLQRIQRHIISTKTYELSSRNSRIEDKEQNYKYLRINQFDFRN